MCSTAIVRAFCGHSWAIFNRGRWLANDEAVSSVVALELCHGLLTKAFYRMVREHFPKEAHLIRDDVAPIVLAYLQSTVALDQHQMQMEILMQETRTLMMVRAVKGARQTIET
eukprot:3205024-Pyramimonas_sp.AAC.1